MERMKRNDLGNSWSEINAHVLVRVSVTFELGILGMRMVRCQFI